MGIANIQINDWIAIASLLAAGVSIIWAIRWERKNIIVRLNYVVGFRLNHAIKHGSTIGSKVATIELVNNGPRAIKIEEYGFQLSNRSKLSASAGQEIGWLASGSSRYYYIPRDTVTAISQEILVNGLWVTRAYIRDSSNHYYKSTTIAITPNWYQV